MAAIIEDRLRAALGWLAGLAAYALPGRGDPRDAPRPEDIAAQARRCRHILKASIVDFYLPASVDRVNGGYLEWLRDGTFAATGERFLTMQARQLWFFSTLARHRIEEAAARAAADLGFRFLEGNMRDRTHGGYYSKVRDDGVPTDRRKHLYLNAFALYGLVAYHNATGDAGGLAAAKDLFRILEDRAHDPRHGGYAEHFLEDWSPIADRPAVSQAACYVGAPGIKTHNTHLHMLEALTDLYSAWPDPLVRQRLAELLTVNVSTVRHPRWPCSIDSWLPDWQTAPVRKLRASYGHDLECVWVVLHAARALGLSPGLLRSWAKALCGNGLRLGYDRRHGGFFYQGRPGRRADDTRKEWWVQAEALVAMLEMYRLTGDATYYAAFRGTLDFVERHQVAPEGGWWATRAANGAPRGTQRSSMWQGAYHSGRAMLSCARLLDELAVPGSVPAASSSGS